MENKETKETSKSKSDPPKRDPPKRVRRFGNDTGTLVMLALEAFQEPATTDQIVSLIADGKKSVKAAIRDSIQETLESGVTYGFLGKDNRRYTLPLTKCDLNKNKKEKK